MSSLLRHPLAAVAGAVLLTLPWMGYWTAALPRIDPRRIRPTANREPF